MRGTYEAFILVEVKNGRKYVCALNRQKPARENQEPSDLHEKVAYLENRVIWN